VRITAVFAALLSLAACHHGDRDHDRDAVRQGVIDHLASSSLGLNMAGMDVAITEANINGGQADVTAAITPKGGPAANGMSMKYHLEQRDNKWVVTGRQNTGGGAPHGAMAPAAGAMPAGDAVANPHGGAMPGGAPAKMPSPDDLPPTGKKE
jgi:hypothetical protein